MKFLIAILLLCSLNSFAEGSALDSTFRIKSSKELKNLPSGLHMTIYCKVIGNLSEDQTVIYSLFDNKRSPFFWSASNREGVISINFLNLKDTKYIYVGGIGDIPVRIDLTKFKGKEVVLEVEVKENLTPTN